MIHITTKATGLRLTPDIARYCVKRLEALEKHVALDDTAARAQVELEKTTAHHQSGNIFRAEITVGTREGNFRAEATAESIYAAIDGMRREIERELRKSKEKHTVSVRSGGRRIKTLLRRG